MLQLLVLFVKKELITTKRSLGSSLCFLIFICLCALATYAVGFLLTYLKDGVHEVISEFQSSSIINVDVAQQLQRRMKDFEKCGIAHQNGSQYSLFLDGSDSSYTISYNQTHEFHDVYQPFFNYYHLFPTAEGRCGNCLDLWTIQKCVDKVLGNSAVNSSGSWLSTPVSKNSKFTLPVMNFRLIGYLFDLVFVMLGISVAKDAAVEKGNSIHTYMMLMGMPRWTYNCAHLISAVVKIWIVAVIAGGGFLFVPVIFFALFFVHFIFAHFIVFLCFLTTTVTNKPMRVSVFCFVLIAIYAVSANVFTFPDVQDYDQAAFLINVVCLLNPLIAIGYIHNHLEIVLKFDQPIRWFQTTYTPFIIPLFWLIFSTCALPFLMMYLDYVLPVDSSSKKHPLFIFGYNASKVHKGDKSEKPGSLKKELKKELFEEEYDSAPVGIEISDVTKKFGTLKVLNHVSFKAFENQVTALLGHNGAGKSTLFGCLTGFVTPTSGSVIVKEKALIGFCPQWDPLFPLLTVVEHLEFYSQLKTGKYDPEEIETVLTKVELENARSTLAMNLSGGMKRKLTVGMAMIGGSQILLLDEPTAGMDPLARRNVINIVNALKQGKTVLLTTHYMDEAELLSDRIIIMAKGTLMCNGSADFLKKKLSTGFILTIVFQHDMKNTDKLAQDILQVVQKHVPDSLIDGPIGNQFTILLPFGSQRKFPDLFGEIESKKNELMIGSFGISANTLEQIFIKITETADVEKKQENKNLTQSFLQISAFTAIQQSWIQQARALVIRKLQYHRRHPFQIIFPFLLFLLITVLTFTVSGTTSADESVIQTFKIVSDGKFTIDTNVCNARNKMILGAIGAANFPEVSNFWSCQDVKNLSSLADAQRLLKTVPPLGFAVDFTNSTNYQIYVRNNYPTAMFSIQNAIANEFKRNGKNITAKFEIYKYNNVLEDKVSFKLSLPIFLMVFPVFIVSFQIFLYHSEVRRFTVQLYRLTGMSKLLYWSVAYIGDFLYCYFFILLMLMFFVVKTVLTTAYFWISFFALIFATICLLTQAYAAAKYVKKVSTAFILFIFIHFYVALLIAGIIEFIFLVSNPQSKAKNIVCALPTFVLPMSFFFKLCVASMMFKTADLSEFIPSFVILVFTTVLHIFSMFLPAIIENMKRKRLQRQAYVVEEQHPDVVAEDLKATTSIEEFTILCRRLRKVYDKKVAVCSLSLAIPEGECFGLLGANGAGKSTSFNMITGSLEPTSGDAFVLGSDVKNKPKFGFCPQSDAVLPDLTVWETLKLFARLSGRQKQDQCVEILLQLLQLKHRANKIVKNCSGGEKRRLSVGVAILTNSQVIMLDEPTAGIDPKTRRQVWDLLMAMRISGTSIVLSSHSMEECETLCTRIGFLSKGVLKAIGTSQHLKSVFGNTFTLKLMLEEIDLDIYNKTNQDVQALFSAEPTKTPPNSIFLTFSIPKKGDSSWTTMYRQVIDFVDRNPYIKDFALTETTLEEVFVQTTQTENDDKKN